MFLSGYTVSKGTIWCRKNDSNIFSYLWAVFVHYYYSINSFIKLTNKEEFGRAAFEMQDKRTVFLAVHTVSVVTYRATKNERNAI